MEEKSRSWWSQASSGWMGWMDSAFSALSRAGRQLNLAGPAASGRSWGVSRVHRPLPTAHNTTVAPLAAGHTTIAHLHPLRTPLLAACRHSLTQSSVFSLLSALRFPASRPLVSTGRQPTLLKPLYSPFT